MWRFFKWLNKRFGTFDLLPEYFTAAGQQIQNVLWGALLPFLVWGIWFIVGTPPVWINWTAVLLALFIAGYYVWRADHIRLEKKLEVTRVISHEWKNEKGKGILCDLEVTNTSEAQTTEWVTVKLEKIVPEVKSITWLPVPLQQKHDVPQPGKDCKTDFNLNPREPKQIDLVSAYRGGEYFSVHQIVRGVNLTIPTGKYRLQVSVRAKDAPELFVWFDVWADDDGVLQCKME